jgi:DNA polymerase lambda
LEKNGEPPSDSRRAARESAPDRPATRSGPASPSGSSGGSGDSAALVRMRRMAPKFACGQRSNLSRNPNHNELLTKQLDEMVDIFDSLGDVWRSWGYKKASNFLKRLPRAVESGQDAWNLSSQYGGGMIGRRIASKIDDIIGTGILTKLVRMNASEELVCVKLFASVWGVGPVKARKLLACGVRSLEDLRARQHELLDERQRIGLRYRDDFLERIPRSGVAEVEGILERVVKSIDASHGAVAVGSYRRGKKTSGDIDVIIVHDNKPRHEGLLARVIEKLTACGLLTDHLTDVSATSTSYMGVCALASHGNVHWRIDLKAYNRDQAAFAIMYFTGSAHFNRSMRLLARKGGLSLSDKGLFKAIRVRGKKVKEGNPIILADERAIFEFFGLGYLPPDMRDV